MYDFIKPVSSELISGVISAPISIVFALLMSGLKTSSTAGRPCVLGFSEI